MLDNENVLKQRDPHGALEVIASQFEQAAFSVSVQNPEHDHRPITSIVVAGMGGSALSALLLKTLLKDQLTIPFEIIRDYTLPAYVGTNTLVIASSYSGNTEETLAALNVARERGAQLAVIASGGELLQIAESQNIAASAIPGGTQPRMATIYALRALIALLENFGIITNDLSVELAGLSGWLQAESAKWAPSVLTAENPAKKIALYSVGKTPVFYGTPLTASLAYKWKISWNETAKNTAFWNEYSEFNHNEFMGWASHPIEKPFAVIDIVSSFDSPRIIQRMQLSDRLLSGKRPHAQTIYLQGESLLAQLLWGAILADYASTYTAILNGVDPVPVALIEKLKQELANDPR